MRAGTWIGILAVAVAGLLAAVAMMSKDEPSSPARVVDRTRLTGDRGRTDPMERGGTRSRVVVPAPDDTDRGAPGTNDATGGGDQSVLPGANVQEPDRPSQTGLEAEAVRAELKPYEGLESIRTYMRYDRTLLPKYGDLRVFAYRLVPEDLDAAIRGYVDWRLAALGEVDAATRKRVEELEYKYWPVVVELQRRQARLYELAHLEHRYDSPEEQEELDRTHGRIGRAVKKLLAARRREFDAIFRQSE